ncbi:hypothetical protein GVN18_29565 [Pseudomonas sp. ODNR1LW]|nr:hypothetical protein [Pseudomonas sp. ODNR1LW]
MATRFGYDMFTPINVVSVLIVIAAFGYMSSQKEILGYAYESLREFVLLVVGFAMAAFAIAQITLALPNRRHAFQGLRDETLPIFAIGVALAALSLFLETLRKRRTISREVEDTQ